MAGEVGIEPTTWRLTAARTASVLLASVMVESVGVAPTEIKDHQIYSLARPSSGIALQIYFFLRSNLFNCDRAHRRPAVPPHRRHAMLAALDLSSLGSTL